jgi:hypothetical protein
LTDHTFPSASFHKLKAYFSLPHFFLAPQKNRPSRFSQAFHYLPASFKHYLTTAGARSSRLISLGSSAPAVFFCTTFAAHCVPHEFFTNHLIKMEELIGAGIISESRYVQVTSRLIFFLLLTIVGPAANPWHLLYFVLLCVARHQVIIYLFCKWGASQTTTLRVFVKVIIIQAHWNS